MFNISKHHAKTFSLFPKQTIFFNSESKVKSFLSHTAHLVALISVSMALSQTPAYAARSETQG